MFNPAEVHSVLTKGPDAVELMFHQLDAVMNREALRLKHSVLHAAKLCSEDRRTFAKQLKRDTPMDEPLLTFYKWEIAELLQIKSKPKQYIKQQLFNVLIEEALILSYGCQCKAAKLIGIDRATLKRRMK